MNYEGHNVYHTYIIANQSKSVLYTGVTNYLARRLHEHNKNILDKKKTFAAKYNCRHLLYYEKFTWVQETIAREKEIKGWRREKKMNLINTINPKFNFLEYLFLYQNS